MRKIITATVAAAALVGGLTACSSDADVASKNLSKAADNFKIARRIVFYNGITDKYILEVDGLCSLGNDDGDKYVSITCETAPGQFQKHFFFRSDNTTVFVQQMGAAAVSTAQYKVIFKPGTILPDVEAR